MHSICAIIAKKSVLELLARRYENARVCDLPLGFALIRLDPELYEEISGDLHHRIVDDDIPFPAFAETIKNELVELSRHGMVAYVETDYFGGEGSQAAIGWENGRTFYGPMPQGQPSINQVLRLMGVEKGDHFDEFDALGLGKFRS